jgi:ankyrin repeat protein
MPNESLDVDDLYERFEEAVNSCNDKHIKEVLLEFKTEDYAQPPIMFDLIVAKKFNILENLYKRGMPFSYRDASGANALHVACGISGSLEAAKFLIERSIFTDINAKTDEGETPFILAIKYNHEDIVTYFLENFKPNMNISTIYGETVLSLAKRAGNQKMVLLLERQWVRT